MYDKIVTIDALNLDNYLCMWIAIKFAEDVEHFWDAAFPNDDKVAAVIREAKRILSNETFAAKISSKKRQSYMAAAEPMSKEGRARMAANAAIGALEGSAICSAGYAVAARQNFRNKELGFEYVSSIITANLSYIIDYKLERKQSYNQIRYIFEAASDSDKEKLLFSLGD